MYSQLEMGIMLSMYVSRKIESKAKRFAREHFLLLLLLELDQYVSLGEVKKPCPCFWLNSPFNLLMELLFGPVRDFDGAI